MAIRESVLRLIENIQLVDQVRVVTSEGGSRRVSVTNLAKTVVENYVSSELGGEFQSVKDVIDETTDNVATLSTSVQGLGDDVSALTQEIQGIVNVLYPIGSYYHTSNPDFRPADAWGGSWSLLGEGQVLLSGSKNGDYRVGTQYGDNSKTIDVANLPSHNHTISHTHTLNGHTHTMSHTHTMAHTHTPSNSDNRFVGYNYKTSQKGVGSRKINEGSGTYYAPYVNSSTVDWVGIAETSGSSSANTGGSSAANTGGSSANTSAASTSNSGNKGDGNAFNVMQKSTAVYIWYRTA